MTVRPAKTRGSLGICPVWSESLLCTQWVAKEPSFLRAVWVFAGHTNHFVGFVMRQLSKKVFETISRFNETLDAETFA